MTTVTVASTPAATPSRRAGGSGRWVRSAGCAEPDLDPVLREVFTTEDWTPWDSQATAVCRGCPVRVDCNTFAATLGSVTGIWGGWRHLDQVLVHPHPERPT